MSNMWPYLAGIVDGEGSIVLYRSKDKYNCEVVIPNTSLKLMKWLVSNFGGKYTILEPKNLHGYNRKMLFRWRVSGKKNRENLLLGILPYLIIKKEQAKIALEFERLGYGEQVKRDELSKRCSLLNRGDESVTTNTLNTSCNCGHPELHQTFVCPEVKIESELIGDDESGPVVTQESQ